MTQEKDEHKGRLNISRIFTKRYYFNSPKI